VKTGRAPASPALSPSPELGCTEFEIMATTGHQTSKEVTRHTKPASKRTRAQSALQKMTGGQNEDKSVPLFRVVTDGVTISSSNYQKNKEEK
jgi:hypothetical protein